MNIQIDSWFNTFYMRSWGIYVNDLPQSLGIYLMHLVVTFLLFPLFWFGYVIYIVFSCNNNMKSKVISTLAYYVTGFLLFRFTLYEFINDLYMQVIIVVLFPIIAIGIAWASYLFYEIYKDLYFIPLKNAYLRRKDRKIKHVEVEEVEVIRTDMLKINWK